MKTKKTFRSQVTYNLFMVLTLLTALSAAVYACGKKTELTKTESAPSSQNSPVLADTDTVRVYVDEMPVYPGGEDALLKFVAENTQYPKAAREKGTQGRVLVRFCVTSKGFVTQSEILQSVSPELDAEALRVINTLPKFEPGKVKGRPVSVWFMLPVTFALK